MRILIWAATAGLGFLGGWLLVPVDNAPPAAPSSPPAFEGVREASPAASDSPTNEASEPQVSEVEFTPSETEAAAEVPSGESLAEVLALYPVKAYETGEGVITGVVLDAAGRPVEGVHLDLIVHGLTPGVEQLGLEHPQALGFILEEIDQYHFDMAFLRRATSGPDGTFRFEGLSPDWQYHVHSGLDNDLYVTVEGDAQQLSAGAELLVRAFPGAWLDCDIVDSNGEPVRPAWLQFQVEVEGELLRRAVPYGHTSPEQIVPTELIEASAVSQTRARSELRTLHFEPGEHAKEQFVVVEIPSIVLLPDGSSDPIDFMGLNVSIIEEGEYQAIVSNPEEHRSLAYAGRNPSLRPGRPTRSRMEPGSYRVLVARYGEVFDEQQVEVRAGSVEVPIAIPPLDRSEIITATVHTSEGAPVDDASFRIEYRTIDADGNVGRTGDRSLESVRIGSGQFALRLQSSWQDRYEGGHYEATLVAENTDLGRTRVPVSAQGGESVALSFETPAYVRIELDGYVGSELQGRVNLSLVREGEESQGSYENPNPRGSKRVGPLSPGTYTAKLLITKQGGYGGLQEELGTVDLVSGENFFRLPLPVLHSVAIRFPDGKPGTSVWVRRENSYTTTDTVIGRDGVAVLEDLSPGTYEVFADRMQQSAMTVIVPTAGELVFTPARFDALGVSIQDSDGWLARAGFQQGDKIVSLDGETFESGRRLQFALLRALSTDGGQVEVQRGGALLVIPIEAGVVTDYNDLGGYLEPTTSGGGR